MSEEVPPHPSYTDLECLQLSDMAQSKSKGPLLKYLVTGEEVTLSLTELCRQSMEESWKAWLLVSQVFKEGFDSSRDPCKYFQYSCLVLGGNQGKDWAAQSAGWSWAAVCSLDTPDVLLSHGIINSFFQQDAATEVWTCVIANQSMPVWLGHVNIIRTALNQTILSLCNGTGYTNGIDEW